MFSKVFWILCDQLPDSCMDRIWMSTRLDYCHFSSITDALCEFLIWSFHSMCRIFDTCLPCLQGTTTPGTLHPSFLIQLQRQHLEHNTSSELALVLVPYRHLGLFAVYARKALDEQHGLQLGMGSHPAMCIHIFCTSVYPSQLWKSTVFLLRLCSKNTRHQLILVALNSV